MSNRWLCVHGHFYQPPRENPWLEEIEYQESAHPFHDWNEQISVKCYGPCSEARILGAEGQVVDVINLYSRISFNFGPTLLSWMEKNDARTYAKILEGDRLSLQRYGGHGSALAQVYNHVIMPLADRRDKETEVRWGLTDFRRRFGREPEAMWLAETAVDTESLEILAEHGMKYVILAPRQAKAYRPLGSDAPWTGISNETFDLQIPYQVMLPSGRRIAAFFYDGAISRELAFGGLLDNGEAFAQRLLSAFPADESQPRLLHVATDGETYGYHHRHGEMALAYAIDWLEKRSAARLTNYGQHLEANPPSTEIQIHERSSWSCAHGVERWRSDCGCAADPGRGWHQKWRAPMRAAFDRLKEQIHPAYEKAVGELVRDPAAARNDYIEVVLDRAEEAFDAFALRHCGRALAGPERFRLAGLLEIQRNLLLVYTSCAWFFDEISGIEAVQNMQYAYRAIVLAQEILGLSLRGPFEEALRAAPSNVPELGSGDAVFKRYAVPAQIGFEKLAAHFAIESVFEDFKEENDIYCYRVRLAGYEKSRSGNATLAFGRCRMSSKITRRELPMMFGVIHLGDHNINAGVTECPDGEQGDARYRELAWALKEAFQKADFPDVIRALDTAFGPVHYSLKDLFRNEQHRVVNAILSGSMSQIYGRLNDLYLSSQPLALCLAELQLPLPRIYDYIAEFVLEREVDEAVQEPDERMDLAPVLRHLDETKNLKIRFDEQGLSHPLERSLEAHLAKIEAQGPDPVTLEAVSNLIALAERLPFRFDLATAQSRFFGLSLRPEAKAAREDAKLGGLFARVASQLKVQLHP